jgi:hypothetical protein
LPRDAPFPMCRSRIVQILNVPMEILGSRKCWREFFRSPRSIIQANGPTK